MREQINQSKPGAMQEGADIARVFQPHLPKMESTPSAPGNSQGKEMPQDPKIHRAPKGETMSAFHPIDYDKIPPIAETGSMQARPDEGAPASSKLSYIRLRVRAAGDRLTLIEAREVDGPLIVSPTIAGEHAYEVLLDSRPITAEGILDVGVSRSFPRPGTDEHYITPRHTFEFNVRIPRSAVTDQTLPRLSITLYGFPDAAPKPLQGTIAAQTGLQARPIAHLASITEAAEPEVHRQLMRIFPKLAPPPKQERER